MKCGRKALEANLPRGEKVHDLVSLQGTGSAAVALR